MTVPATVGDLPELEQPSYGTPDPYQRPAPPPLAGTWDQRPFVEVVAAKQRRELPLAPCSELLGCHDPAVEEGMAALSLMATPWLASPAGTVYGGVLAFLADVVLTGAVATTLPPGTSCSPLDLKVQFVRPVWPDGRVLRATATVAHRGRRFATAHAEVAGRPVAVGPWGRASARRCPGRPGPSRSRRRVVRVVLDCQLHHPGGGLVGHLAVDGTDVAVRQRS